MLPRTLASSLAASWSAGRQVDCRLQVVQGLGALAALSQQLPQITMGLGKLRLVEDGLAEDWDRPGRIALLMQTQPRSWKARACCRFSSTTLW
ncbi:MAG TPA: hypothetical protein VKI17_08710 [Gemmataceae bacterium]|nr:hypothetical protein [Gemmataceae bacterium]